MKSPLLCSLFLLTISFSSQAQCDADRYRNFIFPNFTLTSDILYGSNEDYTGAETSLYLDVYEPTGDIETDRPLVLVVHGGSFVGGSKTGTDVVPICQDLAKMGYVVASIQYRLGIEFSLADLTQNAKAAVIRGAQDSKAAVRYFRKDVAESGNTYDIDPEKIYMLGVSAGGFNALNVAYLDIDEEIPSDIDMSDPGLGGGAEGLSGNPGYSSSIAGVINVAGAIADPDIIQAGDAPICNFHGTDDATVPYGSDVLYFISVFPIDTVHGSASIDARVDALGIENCFEIQEGQGHVPHVTNTLYYDTLRSISVNFLSHLVCPEIELDCEYRELEIISSVDEELALSDVSLWPNPVSDLLNVQIPIEGKTTYRIADITGKEVNTGQLLSGTAHLSVSDLKTGVYFIRFETEHAVRTLRFVKKS